MTAEQLLELYAAQRDGALDVLERLLASFKGIEYTTPEQQATMRRARALLAESGRRVNRERL